MTSAEVLAEISRLWPNLLDDQRTLLLEVARSFAQPIQQWRRPNSDVVPDDRTLSRLGDALRSHHSASHEPFKKEKLEYALQRIYASQGRKATLSTSRTAKFDLEVDEQRWSLKTQADRGITRDRLWISKLMELGQFSWTRDPETLREVVAFVLGKLSQIDRILTLRCLTPTDSTHHEYELVEIPATSSTSPEKATSPSAPEHSRPASGLLPCERRFRIDVLLSLRRWRREEVARKELAEGLVHLTRKLDIRHSRSDGVGLFASIRFPKD